MGRGGDEEMRRASPPASHIRKEALWPVDAVSLHCEGQHRIGGDEKHKALPPGSLSQRGGKAFQIIAPEMAKDEAGPRPQSFGEGQRIGCALRIGQGKECGQRARAPACQPACSRIGEARHDTHSN